MPEKSAFLKSFLRAHLGNANELNLLLLLMMMMTMLHILQRIRV